MPQDHRDQPRRHTAGLFDIRLIIGALLGIYGLVVLITGLVGGSSTSDSTTDGDAIDIWVGVALVVVGVLFAVWARTRPIVVDEAQVERDKRSGDASRNGSD